MATNPEKHTYRCAVPRAWSCSFSDIKCAARVRPRTGRSAARASVPALNSLRSSILYAKDLGLTGGNKNAFYFNSHKDDKFSLRNVHEDFKERRDLYKIMYSNIIPELEKRLVTIEESDLEIIDEESDYSY